MKTDMVIDQEAVDRWLALGWTLVHPADDPPYLECPAPRYGAHGSVSMRISVPMRPYDPDQQAIDRRLHELAAGRFG